jgi:methylenetetrahydrofolate dehydrogenase (NADP+)/methenyltetrahydrofolate cyclohydrolase
MKILNGIKVASIIEKKLKEKIKKNNLKPKLLIIQVGENKASNKYINFKMKKAFQINIEAIKLKYSKNIDEEKLINKIKKNAKNVDGLIVQLPLPKKYDTKKILNAIPLEKDVDGLNPKNNLITPATARGVMDLLFYYKINLKNKKVSVVGKSYLVGKPIAKLCLKNGANVKVHDKLTGLIGSEKADILIVAAGQKNLIKNQNIKKNVVIIDVGINVLTNKKIVGDVDRKSVGKKPSAISPVPGGVGPMTVISLFSNLIDILNKNNK